MKKFVVIIIFTIAIFASSLLFTNKKLVAPTLSPTPLAQVPIEARLEGEYTCLPNRDTTGPVTLECALGLKADGDIYFALDMSAITLPVDQMPQTGDRISVEGILVPIEQINSDSWQKYDIVGVMQVSSISPTIVRY